MKYTHQTAPTQFVEANGIRFAYRRFGKANGVPLVFNQHYLGTMDYWDPTVTDGLARDREVILFNNAGVSSTSGEVPATFEQMGANAVAFTRALVKEEIDGGNSAVPNDYEIGSGVSWRLARAARHSPDPTAIAYGLRRGERLIFEVRVSRLDHPCNAVDLVTAAISTVRFVEHRVFVEDFIDRCASTDGVDFTEHVVEISKQ
jgi:pimeloyl-ACP methyl ester carboxylesterase